MFEHLSEEEMDGLADEAAEKMQPSALKYHLLLANDESSLESVAKSTYGPFITVFN